MTPQQILIVEDDPNTAEMLMAYFSSQDYLVTAVDMGQKALDFVQDTVPDLVVLDIRLPDIDGYQVCRQLRSQRRTSQVPIIFLTERRERIDRLVGLELGAVDYVTKPFDIQELRLRVRNILRRVSMDQVSHPVTGLPFSALVDEKLGELLKEKRWTVLAVGLDGLAEFGEAYGFVARDDVVRAVALMIQRVAEEVSGKRPFVGHLDDSSFFLTLAPKSASGVQKQLGSRLDEAMAFFYPRADLDANQDRDGHELPQLTIRMGTIAGDADSYAKVAELKAAIQESLAPS